MKEKRLCNVCDVCYRSESVDDLESTWFTIAVTYESPTGADKFKPKMVCGQTCAAKLFEDFPMRWRDNE